MLLLPTCIRVSCLSPSFSCSPSSPALLHALTYVGYAHRRTKDLGGQTQPTPTASREPWHRAALPGERGDFCDVHRLCAKPHALGTAPREGCSLVCTQTPSVSCPSFHSSLHLDRWYPPTTTGHFCWQLFGPATVST